eukprot:gnl/TRDRNA2_/TRDRNA2_7727_c0_seq1.p1 gnl/TRDRNA2_/TRDRNA2_7727_c0~~gnl/TRDRNA2_/TRDRNA2_7727_c0_seq1.p1  ORF type:complete len:132 (+),score=8.07 gnl/TRDRNA2_/TRDRNA2_7727_c0_seq1:33-398(+)
MVRVLLENLPAAQLTTSFLMFRDALSLTAQPIPLCSALLSTMSILKKGIDVAKAGKFDNSRTFRKNLGQFILSFSLASIFIGLGAWILAKLYFIQTCDSHMWNLSTGCMHLHSRNLLDFVV